MYASLDIIEQISEKESDVPTHIICIASYDEYTVLNANIVREQIIKDFKRHLRQVYGIEV